MASKRTSVLLLRANIIRMKLQSTLEASIIQIDDVSHQHTRHAAVKGSKGKTHFSMKVVSPIFSGLSPVKHHRMVYATLNTELESGMQTISIVAKNSEETAPKST